MCPHKTNRLADIFIIMAQDSINDHNTTKAKIPTTTTGMELLDGDEVDCNFPSTGYTKIWYQ